MTENGTHEKKADMKEAQREVREESAQLGRWSLTKTQVRDFPDGPVVKTPHFHCRGRGFDPWSGN